MSRGHDRERDICKLLESWGWVTVRAAGSLGPIDVVALGGSAHTTPPGMGERTNIGDLGYGLEPLLIEAKSSEKSAYEHFPPSDRATLAEMAERGGALAVLAWWPKAKGGQKKLDTLQWRWEDEWP